MRIRDYIADNKWYISFYIIMMIITSLVMYLDHNVKVSIENIIYLNILGAFFCAVFLTWQYLVKKSSYNTISKILEHQQKDFLAALPQPSTREQGLYLKLIYKLNQEQTDTISKLDQENKDFGDFINYCVHEMKTPITASRLVLENNGDKSKAEIVEIMEKEIGEIENYVEQVLYYNRADSFSRDYFIGEVDVNALIRQILKKWARVFIAKKVRIEMSEIDFSVNSDKKWLSFIVEQVLLNALKYTINSGTIKIYGINGNSLIIEDNGIGIKEEDIGRVFDKGFTGYNGRENLKATGMGLYLSKKLSNKLGHDISIESAYSKYTRVSINFSPSSEYLRII